jgi:hypothetical protein
MWFLVELFSILLGGSSCLGLELMLKYYSFVTHVIDLSLDSDLKFSFCCSSVGRIIRPLYWPDYPVFTDSKL